MKIVFPHVEERFAELLYIIPVMLILPIITMILFVLEKYFFGNNHWKKMLYKFSSMILLFISLIAGISSIWYPLLYILDYRNENIEKTVDYILEVDGDQTFTEIVSSGGDKYRVYSYTGEYYDIFEKNFINKTCEIEYYKMSKVMRRLKVLE